MPDITLNCRLTGKPFVLREWEQEMLREWGFPFPDLAPEMRHKRRLAHRNERKIYQSKCLKTNLPILSIYHPDQNLPVFSPAVWWGDLWDPRDFGMDYNFNKPFFEQFQELRRRVPRLALMNKNGQNSDYCNLTTDNKNCYLVFGGDYNEDCMYSIFNFKCRDVLDVYWTISCELCYECVDCEHCYNVRYAQNSINCSDSAFLFECRNVKNCFGCVGLVGKEYHIFNRPYSKEDYEATVKKYRLDTWTGVEHMKREFAKFKLQFPHKAHHHVNVENSTGEFLTNVKNAENCFFVDSDAEDIKDIFLGGWGLKNSFSCDHLGHGMERCYEIMSSMRSFDVQLSLMSWTSSYIQYCDMVDSSKHLFGCTAMRRAEYCILNKQYTKEEYEEMIPRIKEHMKSTGEWGQMLPAAYSFFAYNESVAQDFFPLTKEEAKSYGLRWREDERHEAKGPELPDSIKDADASICELDLLCQETGRPYKIIPKELAFYKRLGLPLPRFAHETRNEHRLAMRNPIVTWDRACSKCGVGLNSTYSPERPEIVYCDSCYLAEAY